MSLFETICSHSRYLENLNTVEEKKRAYNEDGKCFDKKYWAFVDSLVPSFLCPIEVIENYVGEKYDFVKHIKPLIDAKLIWIREWNNCFPHSEELAKESLKHHGICKDYEKNVVYLQFYLGPEDPNRNKKFEHAWL